MNPVQRLVGRTVLGLSALAASIGGGKYLADKTAEAVKGTVKAVATDVVDVTMKGVVEPIVVDAIGTVVKEQGRKIIEKRIQDELLPPDVREEFQNNIDQLLLKIQREKEQRAEDNASRVF